MIFRQLLDPVSWTYTYIVADCETREAVIIDPVLECVERDLKQLKENDFKLAYILETHVHADHITGAARLREATGAKIGIAKVSGAQGADLALEEGQEIDFGAHTLRVIATPGHTNGCLSFHIGHMLFTGDALLIRKCGRTDFQEGDAGKLYDNVTKKLFRLPEGTEVWPGHGYDGVLSSSIGEEKKYNVRLGGGRSREDFIKIMSELKLDAPKKLDVAVPANLKCGMV